MLRAAPAEKPGPQNKSLVQVLLPVDLPWSCCPRGCSLELAAGPYHELSIHPPAGGARGDACEGPCTGMPGTALQEPCAGRRAA